jgi:flagellar motor protein MotB
LVNEADGLVSAVTAQGAVLGTVLFETDQAIVRPQYHALLQKVAAYLNRQGGGVVSITGHTDVRASHAYNQKLGMQRAQAVLNTLLKQVSDEVRSRIRVELMSGEVSSSLSGPGKSPGGQHSQQGGGHDQPLVNAAEVQPKTSH